MMDWVEQSNEIADLRAKLTTAETELKALREACQYALDWQNGEGEFSDGKDGIPELAEKVGPKLEAALAIDAARKPAPEK